MLRYPVEVFERIQSFIEMGGNVLFVLFFVTMVMWLLILERIWYFRVTQPREAQALQKDWFDRTDRRSWYAHQIRRFFVSEMELKVNQGLPMIKTLIAICPLLGLLGTVTGMIEVFDVMAVAGNGNPRAMAAGVSKATIPTMAGMVAALSGFYLSARLQRSADQAAAQTEDHLTPEVTDAA